MMLAKQKIIGRDKWRAALLLFRAKGGVAARAEAEADPNFDPETLRVLRALTGSSPSKPPLPRVKLS